jgi:hypothetical protein
VKSYLADVFPRTSRPPVRRAVDRGRGREGPRRTIGRTTQGERSRFSENYVTRHGNRPKPAGGRCIIVQHVFKNNTPKKNWRAGDVSGNRSPTRQYCLRHKVPFVGSLDPLFERRHSFRERFPTVVPQTSHAPFHLRLYCGWRLFSVAGPNVSSANPGVALP